MQEFGRLVLKVAISSLVLSAGIKGLAQVWVFPATDNLALLFVLFPPVAIAVWLGQQEWRSRSSSADQNSPQDQ